MKVIVLLSSYNGEKYIEQQIQSILNQTIHCDLLVRDDGSSDGTINILKQYQAEGRLLWYSGNNLGPSESFFNLIRTAGPADYYALADQDDVWELNKIESAVRKLENVEGPKLYFCKRKIVDQYLNPIDVANTRVISVDPGTSLIEGIAYGCTMVFDYKTKEMIESFKRDHFDYMHDAFIYRLISLCGNVIYDSTPYIRYRQHSHNVVGHELTGLKRWKARFLNLPKRKASRTRSDCAKDIYINFKDKVNTKYIQLLYNFAFAPEKLTCRLKICLFPGLHTQHPFNILFLKVFIILGWI